MKKTVSLLLSVLMLLSVCGVFAAAEDDVTYYTVTYIIKDLDGNVTYNESQSVAAGEKPNAPDNPEGFTTENGTVYEFSGWISSVESDTEKRFYKGTMPAVTGNVTYTAEFLVIYEPTDTANVTTLFSFLQGIFQNLTRIFAASTQNVKSWTAHLGKASDFFKELFENVF